MKIIFHLVNFIIISCSLFLVIFFWSDFIDYEYPILTYISLVFFLPYFFIIFFSSPCIFLTTTFKSKFKRARIFLVIIIYLLSTVFAMNSLQFSFFVDIKISILFSLPAWLHFIIYIIIHKKLMQDPCSQTKND